MILSGNAWCGECGDEYDPINPSPSDYDPDELTWCSDQCKERHLAELDESNRVDHMR